MIWKDYLKLSEIASYSKLVLASKAPPLPPTRRKFTCTQLFLIYIYIYIYISGWFKMVSTEVGQNLPHFYS